MRDESRETRGRRRDEGTGSAKKPRTVSNRAKMCQMRVFPRKTTLRQTRICPRCRRNRLKYPRKRRENSSKNRMSAKVRDRVVIIRVIRAIRGSILQTAEELSLCFLFVCFMVSPGTPPHCAFLGYFCANVGYFLCAKKSALGYTRE